MPKVDPESVSPKAASEETPAPEPERPMSGAGRDRLHLAVILALAFLLRFLPFPGLTSEGLRLVSMDDYGHLRRAVSTVRDFPRVPVFDPYLHPPEGALWIWPPLFDLAIATPAWLLFGADAEPEEVLLLAALLPPLLGALSIIPLFFFARRVLGRAAAFVTVGLYTLLPAAVRWSSFGHADQHAGEAFCLVLVLAAVGRAFSGRGGWGVRVATEGPALALAGLALAAAVLTWQGAVFLAVILAAAAVIASRAIVGGIILLIAAALVAPFVLGHPGPLTYVSFGAFQPLFLLLLAGLLFLAGQPRWGLPAALVAGLAAAFTWPPIAGSVRHLLSATSGAEGEDGGYLFYPAEWLRLIGEYRPLWRDDPAAIFGELSLGVLAVPVMIAVWAHRAWRRSEERPGWTLLAVTALTVLAMALLQKRYVYYLVVIVALALAAALVEIARRSRPWVAAVAGLAMLVPCWAPLAAMPGLPGAAGSDVFYTLRWLGQADPPAVDPHRPSKIEPGQVAGVALPWSLGHLSAHLTGRPSLADNFGYGFDRQSFIYTAPPEDDAEVARRLVEWNCRYLITTPLEPLLPAYAAAVGREGLPVSRMLGHRVHESAVLRPLPFLELIFVSQTARPRRDGTFSPLLKIYRIVPP